MPEIAHGESERSLTLQEIARLVGGELRGDGSALIRGVEPVDEAEEGELAFLVSRRYLRFVQGCGASAFLVSDALAGEVPPAVPSVVVANAQDALRILLEHFHPVRVEPARVHPSAVIGRGVSLGDDVDIAPYAVIEDRVTIGDRTRIGAHSVVGAGSTIGTGCLLHSHVVLYPGTVLGSDVILHSGVRLGADGFGYVLVDGAHRKIPQVGRTVLGDGVEIGANTTIDRGSLGNTVVGDGVKIDNLVQLGHNVRVGAFSMFAAMVGVAGSTRIGRGVWMGGQAGAINGLAIGDGARIAVGAGVMRDVPTGETVSGHPARPHREDLRKQAHLARLPKLVERVKRLEAELERLKRSSSAP